MKRFLLIVVGAALLFIAGAMTEEWEVFAGSWFTPPAAASPVSDEEKGKALETLRQYVTLSAHLYGTVGDPRFADRIPASPEIIEEISSEIAYLRNHRLVEDRVLQRATPLEVQAAGNDRLEVTTREYWIVRRYRLGSSEPEWVESHVAVNQYRLLRDQFGRWNVVGWEPVIDPEPQS